MLKREWFILLYKKVACSCHLPLSADYFYAVWHRWQKYCIVETWIYAVYYINVRKVQTALSKQQGAGIPHKNHERRWKAMKTPSFLTKILCTYAPCLSCLEILSLHWRGFPTELNSVFFWGEISSKVDIPESKPKRKATF